MAAKKTTSSRSARSDTSIQQQAEILQHKLGESAQQIWLAGVGAFGRAQTEGNRMFNALVKEGGRVEQQAGVNTGKASESIDERMHGARSRVTQTLEKADQAFRSKMQSALNSLEVPTRRELGALIDRLDAINDQLRRHNQPLSTASTKPAPKKSVIRKKAASPGRTAAKKVAAKQPAPRKTVKKAASRSSVKKSARPASE